MQWGKWSTWEDGCINMIMSLMMIIMIIRTSRTYCFIIHINATADVYIVDVGNIITKKENQIEENERKSFEVYNNA